MTRPNREIISKLSEAYNVSIETKINDVYTLTFSLPFYIDINHRLERNKNVDLLREKYWVKVVLGSKIEWFIINEINNTVGNDSESKTVKCFAGYHELTNRNIEEYSVESYNAEQVLTDVLAPSLWTIDYLDADFKLTYRAFDFPENNILDCVFSVAETYNAIVSFNTDSRTISMTKPELTGVNRGLTFSYGKYMKSMDHTIKTDEIVTRMSASGQDGLGIQRVNPTGQNYIENYGYWIYPFERDAQGNIVQSSYFMSDSLCSALLDYEILVENNAGLFSGYLDYLETYETDLSTLNVEMNVLQNEEAAVQQVELAQQFDGKMFKEKYEHIDNTQRTFSLNASYAYAVMIKIANNNGLSVYLDGQIKPTVIGQWVVLGKVNNISLTSVSISGGNSEVFIEVANISISENETSGNEEAIINRYCLDHKQDQITTKQNEINIKTNDINTVKTQITSLQSLLSAENNFTTEQLRELNLFMYERKYNDENIIDAQDLYDATKEKFNELQQPQLDISIDIVNFLEVIEEQANWNKLNLGDFVNVKYEPTNTNITARITQIDYDYEEFKIKLVLSNAKNANDEEKRLEKFLKNTQNTNITVDINKNPWGKAVIDTSEMSQLFENFWNKITNEINMASNEYVTLDRTGLTIVDPNDPLRFLRATHGVLALTDNGGLLYRTAISASGIIAEQVLGKIILGQRVVIGTNDGIWMTEGPQTTITDRYGRIAMKFGLYEENPDLYGIVVNRYDGYLPDSALINRIIINSEDGFKIQRWTGAAFEDKLYADYQGYLFSEDMTTKRLKIVSDTDELMLDSYTKFMDIGKFDNILTDGKLTSLEKLQVLGERTRIMSEYVKLLAQANDYKTTTRDSTIRIDPSNLTNTYNTLIDYLSPLLDDMNATTSVDRSEFIQRFKDYYDEVTNIINAINDSIRYSSVQLGTYYNNVVMTSEDGILVTRSDTMYRTVMNAIKGFAIQRNTNTAEDPIWQDLFWADTNGWITAEGLRINNSFFTEGDITAANINGSSITLRSPDGGVMKLFPGLNKGFWAGINAENPEDAPTWIKMDGTAIFKKLIVTNGNNELMIDSENNLINFNNWSATGIAALDAQLISANMVSAELGYISDIVAKSLSTMTRAAIAGWSNFIEIQGKTIDWVTGHVVQGEQITVNGKPMYWVSSSQTGLMTTDVTPWPVYKYSSDDNNKLVKMRAGFDGDGNDANPFIDMGIGDGSPNGAKARIYKYNGGWKVSYGSSNYGKDRSIDLRDDGITILSDGSNFNAKSKDFNFIVDSGIYKISLSNGSTFEISPTNGLSGNIVGPINLTSSGPMNFKAPSYNFDN
ncbi:phage tail spike protein [Paenibacillus sophorae]|uniref:phage tail spike protein n=1 Tax=Paenibacillus sophorae TaxID=1333845 RepID=UPI001587B20F|nr:phage tail spike protein [Paenibacillus sophorae]